MNLSEERNYQKLMGVLDALELSAANRRLAEQYLDSAQAEDRELLTQAERQDFSGLDMEKRKKSAEYVAHCRKRERKEEAGRFVRFVAAAGGSTACYVLATATYGWNLDSVQEFLSKEQAAAMRAEGMAWNVYALRHALKGIREKDTEVLGRAMKLCYHKNNNVQVLIAGIYLYYTRPAKVRGGFFGSVFSKKETDMETAYMVRYLETALIDNIAVVFGGGASFGREIKKLQDFVRGADREAALPQELFTVMAKAAVSDYLVTLFAGAAFLGIEHSDVFVAFLHLAIALDKRQRNNTALDICFEIGGADWFSAHVERLEEGLFPQENYIRWCLFRKMDKALERMVRHYPDAVRHVAEDAPVELYQSLMPVVKKHNPSLYQEMDSSYSATFRRKLAEELAGTNSLGHNEAKQYLLGEAELGVLYPFVDGWRGKWDYDNKRSQIIQKLRGDRQEEQMYRRAVVLEGLCMRARYFCSYWHDTYRRVDREEITEILRIFEEEKLPVRYQLEALGGIHDSLYQDKDKADFINESVMALRLKKKEWREELVLLSREGLAVVRLLCIRVMDEFAQEYKKELLSCAMDGSRQVRELLAAVYALHKEWEEDIKAMLVSKKAQERELAVLVLKQWGAEAYHQELEAALGTEKSKKIKELLQGCLGMEREAEVHAAGEGRTMEQLAKEILKGGKKRKVAWVWEAALPQVHKTDGSLADQDYLSAILAAYADMGIPGVSADAARLAEALDPEELSAFVAMIFARWLEGNAEAKKKWVLYAASIHGGENIIPAIHAQIQEWPRASRGAMAAEAVKALALNGSPTALLLVDQIARKFKFRQVKSAAADALASAAEQLGISRAELEDRIVPNLGFDERMEQAFDFGTRKFKVILTVSLELEVYDENGKRLKNLPAPGQKDDPVKAKAAADAFRLLKKQLKTVVSNQKLRLDQAMSMERVWPVERWKELFVCNPVMHQFAMGLIWGMYEDGKLTDTFRYMEDGTFNTVDEDEYELPQTGMVGLVHPVELEAGILSAWKEQLSDYEVAQPIEQLERPVYWITEGEKEQGELTRFGGKLLNGLSLSGRLQSQGWYRGSVLDGGSFCTFYREDGSIGVELEFSGCIIGDENEEITVYGAQFYKAETVKRGSYVYDEVKDQNRFKLGEVSPRYFSEIVLQLTKATASSKEQLAYPECRGKM